jgi:hypothetical protein
MKQYNITRAILFLLVFYVGTLLLPERSRNWKKSCKLYPKGKIVQTMYYKGVTSFWIDKTPDIRYEYFFGEQNKREGSDSFYNYARPNDYLERIGDSIFLKRGDTLTGWHLVLDSLVCGEN